ncbi:EAL domain-containing protein [Arthrobacter sp. PAMC25564]|uniref:EAL domain-containing protein n=1 Tax=Arthrobacter sp. PAMC25564 TaxID=2565366 RepID=UPI0010A27933|nr:EAL domain-containing protein [Arthrobacter sp. PAMC25564]QCB97600.1 EAL domain-containing protein [Arthrobacter sp. PAMC25564]
MARDPLFFSAHYGSEPPAEPLPGSHYGDDDSGIRRQASEIIRAVLADQAPGEARARDQLREHVAAHPGQPEKALAQHLMALRSASRIEAVLNGRMLLTAFQPIFDLSTGAVIGVEAFTRFVSDGPDAAGWFAEAAEERLGSELEFAALECALTAAQSLPAHLYVALKLSPDTCLDPLLPEVLQASALAPDRMVLQLTDPLTAEQAAALVPALLPLRRRGVRLAVDHVGSYFDSIRHTRLLGPDIIKLDRNLIAGIDTDTLRHAFGEAMTVLAEEIGAALIAEGIETRDELGAVTGLGMTAGQGYFLGRPSTRPQDWAGWNLPAGEFQALIKHDGAARS